MSKKQRLLQRVLGVHLFDQLTVDLLVCNVRIGLRGHTHRRVLQDGDIRAEVTDETSRKLALLGHSRSELPGVILDVPDVRLDLNPELLEVLDD